MLHIPQFRLPPPGADTAATYAGGLPHTALAKLV
jgi:hypothetical protein